MGQFPPGDRANEKLIPGWRQQPGMMGLRWVMLYGDQPRQLREGAFDWIWPAAEKAGVPVALLAGMFLDKFRWIAETPSAAHADHRSLRAEVGRQGRAPRWSISTSCWRSPSCPTSR